MESASGRFVTAYNGEIYNHLELRRQLLAEGGAVNWRGTSDTEILLAGFEHWGIGETLRRVTACSLWLCGTDVSGP